MDEDKLAIIILKDDSIVSCYIRNSFTEAEDLAKEIADEENLDMIPNFISELREMGESTLIQPMLDLSDMKRFAYLWRFIIQTVEAE